MEEGGGCFATWWGCSAATGGAQWGPGGDVLGVSLRRTGGPVLPRSRREARTRCGSEPGAALTTQAWSAPWRPDPSPGQSVHSGNRVRVRNPAPTAPRTGSGPSGALLEPASSAGAAAPAGTKGQWGKALSSHGLWEGGAHLPN